VFGAIDDAHSAPADDVQDAIGTDGRWCLNKTARFFVSTRIRYNPVHEEGDLQA
jgi:hypothetical protein